MKKQIIIVLLTLVSFNWALAQSDCPITNGNMTVFTEMLSSTVNSDFDSEFGLTEILNEDGEPTGTYEICTDWFEPINGVDKNVYNNTNIIPDLSSDNGNRQDMCFYHLQYARRFLIEEFGYNLNEVIQFETDHRPINNNSVPSIGITLAQNQELAMLQYSVPPLNSTAYAPAADDVYAIVNGLFQYVIETESSDRAQVDGISYALGNYFAHRYLLSQDPAADNKIYEYGDVGNSFKTLDVNMAKADFTDFPNGFSSINEYYENVTGGEQKRSEVLTACLWQISQDTNGGESQSDQLIMDVLPYMKEKEDADDLDGIGSQYEAAILLYDTAAPDMPGGDGWSDEDLCIMIDIFSRAYDDKFYNELVKKDENGVSLHYIPVTDGDIYIRDDADDEGAEPEDIGSVFNSVDIWNRHEDNNDDGTHQTPLASSNTDYLKVRINGNFCGIATANGNILSTYKMEIYRTDLSPCNPGSSIWQSDFSGYLLGTYDFSNGDLILPSDPSNPIENALDFMGDHAIITCPWITPDWPSSPTKCGIDNAATSFMVRLVDENPTGFDPITYDLVDIPAPQYAYQNNNVAFKRSMVMHPFPTASGPTVTPTHGVIMPGGDPDDEIIISIFPSIPTIHGSDEDIFEIGDPDFGEDYTDYGDVAIVLDDDTFADWIAGGAQGGGFTITQDQEIIITTPEGFFLGGIPASSGDDFRTAEIRYLAASNFKSVAFDIQLSDQGDGSIRDQIHVEVWHENQQQAGTRSSKLESTFADELVLSPNPIKDGYVRLALDQDIEIKSIAIYNIQGQLQLQQNAEGNSVQINMANVDSGLYIVRVISRDGKTYTKKGMKL